MMGEDHIEESIMSLVFFHLQTLRNYMPGHQFSALNTVGMNGQVHT